MAFLRVFPTCVGVFLASSSMPPLFPGLPHVRGGVSRTRPWTFLRLKSSPRAWGCFRSRAGPPAHGSVFPTCVGVFPEASICGTPHPSLPHVRGGVSCSSGRRRVYRWSSPRAWGCFCASSSHTKKRRSLPHVRGGVSGKIYLGKDADESSPRAWGCFREGG